MSGDCPYHDLAVPQWCDECGGFVCFFCAICGETVSGFATTPGHCRCVGGSRQWVDGPSPTSGLLMEAAMRMDGMTEITSAAKAEYMRSFILGAIREGGN